MDILLETIKIRYAAEASGQCCLSCGSVLDHSNLQNGEVIVDLGSGRGTDIIKATKYIGKSGKAIGIDLTSEMIEIAKKNAEKLNIKNAEFIQGNFEEIPLPDQIADVVISNCAINHAKDKEKIYKEIFRILKNGGRFIISDIIAEKELPEEVKNDPEAWANCYGGAITKNEYFNCIAKAGFKEIEILEESEPYLKENVLLRSITIKSIKEI